MKKLKRIIMVNWYLFEAEEWDIEGNVALVGKNGSGKSSFIDAIQLIMLGGSKADWRPNAKAANKLHKRDIRGYVLGIVKDEAAIGDSQEYQPREDALSRVVLVFGDDVTGEVISVGGAFSARRADPQAEFEGYFIAHGLDMHVGDLLDDMDCVRSYSEVKAFCKQQTQEGDLYLFAHEPKKFMEQMMYSLGPDGRPTVLQKFRRAFKQSINMSGLEGSVSEFVKSSILDPQPLNLDQVRQSVDSYRNKQDAVTKINAQIKSLTEIDTLYQKARNAGERRAGYAWCAEEFHYNSITEEADELFNALQTLWERYQSVKVMRNDDGRELVHAQEQLNGIQLALGKDDPYAQQERLKMQRSTLEDAVTRTRHQIRDVKQQLGLASDAVRFRRYLPDNISDQLDNLVKLADGEVEGWPTEPVVIDQAVKAATGALPELMSQVDDKRNDIGVQASQLRQTQAEDEAVLERLKGGGSNLRRNTLALVEALADAGIEATPVCELVEVTDTQWQPAIEGYLRGNTQALIVPPHRAREAVEIYRGLKKHAALGATVVNTERVQSWQDNIVSGTAAALIEGTNPEAVTYLRRLLRGIRLVHETHAFMKEDRALTRDGMFIRQAGIQRLVLPETPILGKQARELQLQRIEARVRDQLQQLIELNEQYTELKHLYSSVSSLQMHLQNVQSLETLVSGLTRDLRQVAALNQQIEAIDTSHVGALKSQQVELEARVKRLGKQVSRHVGDLGGIRGAYKLKNQERHKLDRLLPQLTEARKKLEGDDDYDAERAGALYEALESEYDLSDDEQYAAVIKKAIERAEDASSRQHNYENSASERLGTYISNYETEGFWRDNQSLSGVRADVDGALRQLIGIGLHEREKEVKEALYKVQRIIRSDLAIRLRGHIHAMKLRIAELNQELKQRPFSDNQKYEFTYRRLDEYSELLRFIESADQDAIANVDSMFDEFEHLNEWIEKILDEEQGDLLGDYRNYYNFDIAIKDEKAGITEMLSRKIGSASGGEHKTPFYVAMGASLASAYRLERLPDEGIHGGASLYLADEAFEKMDRVNTLQAAGYLKSIGLQLFVAAPDDAEPRLREVVDTVMFFIREGAVATIELDYIKPKARELLAQLSQAYSDKAATA